MNSYHFCVYLTRWNIFNKNKSKRGHTKALYFGGIFKTFLFSFFYVPFGVRNIHCPKITKQNKLNQKRFTNEFKFLFSLLKEYLTSILQFFHKLCKVVQGTTDL